MDETSEWFDAAEGRTDAEAAFVRVVNERARGWSAFGVTPQDANTIFENGKLVLWLDVCSPLAEHILRCLKVEFEPMRLVMGDDETGQGGYPLDPARPDVSVVLSLTDPDALASAAADWFEHELKRPIECREWERSTFRHRRWVLADSGRELTWWDSAHQRRGDLGPPDAVQVLRPYLR